MHEITLHILSALPGSGKTTFAKECSKNEPQKYFVIDIDNERHFFYSNKKPTVQDLIYSAIKRSRGISRKTDIILDGLFLNNEDIASAIKSVNAYFKVIEVVVHRWNEDRKTCVKNDGGRREIPSVSTILNADFEELNTEKIIEHFNDINVKPAKFEILVENHTVILKEDWYRFFRGNTMFDSDGFIRSNRWCTGGATGNCYDSQLSPVSAEEPEEFTSLDELLEEIVPSLTFLHYKKIYRECVITEATDEPDYYGGGYNYMNWACDLKKLYNQLNELGYNVEDKT